MCPSIDLCVCLFASGDQKSSLGVFPKVSVILLFEMESQNLGDLNLVPGTPVKSWLWRYMLTIPGLRRKA